MVFLHVLYSRGLNVVANVLSANTRNLAVWNTRDKYRENHEATTYSSLLNQALARGVINRVVLYEDKSYKFWMFFSWKFTLFHCWEVFRIDTHVYRYYLAASVGNIRAHNSKDSSSKIFHIEAQWSSSRPLLGIFEFTIEGPLLELNEVARGREYSSS